MEDCKMELIGKEEILKHIDNQLSGSIDVLTVGINI